MKDDERTVKDELDTFCVKQTVLGMVIIAASFLACFCVVAYYRIKERAFIGYCSMSDETFGKQAADAFYKLKINSANVSAGTDAMEKAGYGRNAFAYISRLNGETAAFVIVLAILAALFIAELMIALSLKNNEAVINIVDLVNENTTLKEKIENERIYNEKQNKRMQDFIENISHQIKTPLSAIAIKFEMLAEMTDKSMSDFFKNEDEKEHYRNIINVGLSNTFKIKRFIKMLLDISRLEAGKVIMADDEMEIQALIIQSIDGSECDRENVVTSFCDGKTTIYADEDWIVEGFANIINNCANEVKSQENGKIYVETGIDENTGNSEKYGGAEFRIVLPTFKYKSKINVEM